MIYVLHLQMAAVCLNVWMSQIQEDAHCVSVCPSSGSSDADGKARSDPHRMVLVMFLGGCTFSEISALRFLGKEKGREDLI